MRNLFVITKTETTTLFMLYLLSKTILAEGLTEENREDLERYAEELKAIINKAGLGKNFNSAAAIIAE